MDDSGQSELTRQLLSHPMFGGQQQQQQSPMQGITNPLAQAMQDYGRRGRSGDGGLSKGLTDWGAAQDPLAGLSMFGPTASGPMGAGLGGAYTAADAAGMAGGAGLDLSALLGGLGGAGVAEAGAGGLADLLPLLLLA